MSNPLIKNDEETTANENKKPKQEAKAAPSAAEKELELLRAKLAQSEAEIQAIKAGNTKFEQDTLRSALQKAGLTPEQYLANQKAKEAQEDVLELDLGNQILHINGHPYSGIVRAKRGVVEMLQSMAGNSRNQKMREMLGRDHVVETLSTGAIRSRVIRTIDPSELQ